MSNDQNRWQCPVCETVNTGDICAICGTKIERKNEIFKNSQNDRNDNTLGLQTESFEMDNISKDSAEKPQRETGRWARIGAIAVLLVTILPALLYVFVRLYDDYGYYYQPYYDVENHNDEDAEQICNQLDVVDVQIGTYYDENFGVNMYDEIVWWLLYIQIDGDLDSVTTVQTSWADNISWVTDSIYAGDEYADYCWQSALMGNTLWYYDGESIEVVLPDDPNIAGEQYILLNDTKITFDLTYRGDYSTGTGWNYVWECGDSQYCYDPELQYYISICEE